MSTKSFEPKANTRRDLKGMTQGLVIQARDETQVKTFQMRRDMSNKYILVLIDNNPVVEVTKYFSLLTQRIYLTVT